MKKRILEILLTISAIATILFCVLKKGEQIAKDRETLKNQKQEIILQNDIIQETKKVVQRKNINKSTSSDDNLDWLQNNRCKDC